MRKKKMPIKRQIKGKRFAEEKQAKSIGILFRNELLSTGQIVLVHHY
jgi:hypothetical protein